jgi:hypothetical protein
MIKDNKESLFWIPLMKHFYDVNKEDDPDVLDAWYQYVFYYLPTVSKQWRISLNVDNLKNRRMMFPILSVSDEAVVQWFLEIMLEKVEERYKLGFKKEKDFGKGKHDTNINIERYTILHSEISEKRKNYECVIRWNKLFWLEVEKKHADRFNKKRNMETTTKSSIKNTLPLPDMNEEEDIFEMYSQRKQQKFNDNIEVQPDEVGSFKSL